MMIVMLITMIITMRIYSDNDICNDNPSYIATITTTTKIMIITTRNSDEKKNRQIDRDKDMETGRQTSR